MFRIKQRPRQLTVETKMFLSQVINMVLKRLTENLRWPLISTFFKGDKTCVFKKIENGSPWIAFRVFLNKILLL